MKEHYKVYLALVLVLFFMAGCSSTSDVVEEQPEPQATAPEPEPVESPPPVVMQEIPEPEPEVQLDTVFYFDYDQANLRPDVRNTLSAYAEKLKESSETIRVEGYADERGSEDYNRALGERRANAVRDFLISMGVSASQIQTVSYGEENPRIAGNDESAWQENRRVEIK